MHTALQPRSRASKYWQKDNEEPIYRPPYAIQSCDGKPQKQTCRHYHCCDGIEVRELWKDDLASYCGLAVSGSETT